MAESETTSGEQRGDLAAANNARLDLSAEVDRIVARSRESLADLDVQPTLTDQGLRRLQRSIEEYIRDVVTFSGRISLRRDNDGVITSADVGQAERFLVGSRGSTLSDQMGTIGGVLLGGGLGNLVNVVATDSSLTAVSVILTLVLCVVGVALMAYQITRSLR